MHIKDEQIKEEIEQEVKEEVKMVDTEAITKPLVDFDTREKSCGIMLRVGSHSRFSGIIKQRFEDFAVREVNPEGVPVKLADFKHIDPEQDPTQTDEEEENTPFTEEEQKMIEEFVEQGEVEHEDDQIALNVTDRSKEDKLRIHEYVKRTFNLRSFTTRSQIEEGQDPDSVGSELVICWKSNKRNAFQINRNKVSTHRYPSGMPDFCHFTVQKHNMDTMFVVTLLSKFIHCEPKRFAYAGTKDKRSVAYQRMSAFRISSKRLADMNRICRNLGVGNFSYSDKNIKLGDLSGNQFTCVIRDITGTEEEVDAACTSMRDSGFINYFGLQRFGSFSLLPTYVVGKAMIQNRWEDAVNMVLTPREGENASIKKAKEIWQETKDPEAAQKNLPRWAYGQHEAKLLNGLKRVGANRPKEAFKQMPYQMRTLYLHSYQSYIFNNALSTRLETYGYEPVAGDLVLISQDEGKPDVRVLTKATCKKHTIFDVVMPMPGFDMKYPTHSIADIYKELLQCDGLETDMVTKSKECQLSGSYRNIMVLPKEMTWKTVKYTDHHISLTSNDFHDITGFECSDMQKKREYFPKSNPTPEDNAVKPEETNEDTAFDKEEKIQAEPEVPPTEPLESKALCLMFTLPTSSYATCAFRELLTSECSLEAQQALNNKFNAKFQNRSTRDNRKRRNNKGSNNKGHFNKKKKDQTQTNATAAPNADGVAPVVNEENSSPT